MIPKKIHYCWFGKNKKTESMEKCIESWKRFCPDYEITEWNEDNFDINCIPFVKEAYEAGKWAFVSDYARLKIIYDNGGIYLDTDVELIKSLDDLLNLEAYAGFEGDTQIATGLGFGAEKGHPMVYALMEDYHNRCFSCHIDDLMAIACPVINTKVFEKYGFEPNGKMQTVNGMKIFPKEYFNPMDSQIYELNVTEKTYSIHRYDATWRNQNSALKKAIIRAFVKVFGKKVYLKLKEKKR